MMDIRWNTSAMNISAHMIAGNKTAWSFVSRCSLKKLLPLNSCSLTLHLKLALDS